MAGDDRLSVLADDLLRRILYFVPFKEAASSSVLSRRWGSLRRSSGAINLDVRVPYQTDHNGVYRLRDEVFFARRDGFVHAAKAALDAADARVTRLTLRVEDPTGKDTYKFLNVHSIGNYNAEYDVVGALVSHATAAHVEEFHVAVITYEVSSFPYNEEERRSFERTYELGSLPSKALRVLDLTRCKGLKPPPATTDAYPCLETLRLRLCSLKSSDVQALVDAAPGLATVHLESVFFKGFLAGAAKAPGVCLRFRAVTELVLEFCGMEGQSTGNRGSIDIDAPRLRYFRYKGSERRFSLTSPAPDMAVLELEFLQDPNHRQGHNYDPDRTRLLFWEFVRNFTNARVLKLKVNRLKDIAVGKARRTELLCTFCNAVRLELEGAHRPASKAAAVAIANLLRCRPLVRDLRLNLSTVPSNSVKKHGYGTPLDDYEKSVDRFMRRGRLNPVISVDDNDKHHGVPESIPGLSGHSLTCLQSSLRRVGLQFRQDDSSCFGTRLVKFFTGNAKVLEEIYVDSGNWKLCEHINLNVERWIAPTSSKVCLKRKNLAESSLEFSKIPIKTPNDDRTDLVGLATSFTVLPLERGI